MFSVMFSVMLSCGVSMCWWSLLLWMFHAVCADPGLSIVTQWPAVVEVQAGEMVSLNCSVLELYSPCSSVAWLRTHPHTRTLSTTDSSRVSVSSSSSGWTEICSALLSSRTIQDSGMYYCVVVQGKFAHIGNGSRVIVKDPSVSPEVEVISAVSSRASVVPLQCLISGVLPTQVSVYWLIDGKVMLGHTRSAWTHKTKEVTRNQVLLSAEVWHKHPQCECVVEYGSLVLRKTLQQQDTHSTCEVIRLLYMLISLFSSLLILIIIIYKLTLCFNSKLSKNIN